MIFENRKDGAFWGRSSIIQKLKSALSIWSPLYILKQINSDVFSCCFYLSCTVPLLVKGLRPSLHKRSRLCASFTQKLITALLHKLLRKVTHLNYALPFTSFSTCMSRNQINPSTQCVYHKTKRLEIIQEDETLCVHGPHPNSAIIVCVCLLRVRSDTL